MNDYAPLQHLFKQQGLNKHQSYWLQELIDTPILIVFVPEKQAAVPNVLSCSPILYDFMDMSADSQPSGVG